MPSTRSKQFIQRKLKKLLIVEDNKQQNLAIREMIGNGDVKSFSAMPGLEAYELLQKENFDCIIIDLGLPDMTGLELLERIKSKRRFKQNTDHRLYGEGSEQGGSGSLKQAGEYRGAEDSQFQGTSAG
jgi:CheY-like chemotaxis protein